MGVCIYVKSCLHFVCWTSTQTHSVVPRLFSWCLLWSNLVGTFFANINLLTCHMNQHRRRKAYRLNAKHRTCIRYTIHVKKINLIISSQIINMINISLRRIASPINHFFATVFIRLRVVPQIHQCPRSFIEFPWNALSWAHKCIFSLYKLTMIIIAHSTQPFQSPTSPSPSPPSFSATSY